MVSCPGAQCVRTCRTATAPGKGSFPMGCVEIEETGDGVAPKGGVALPYFTLEFKKQNKTTKNVN